MTRRRFLKLSILTAGLAAGGFGGLALSGRYVLPPEVAGRLLALSAKEYLVLHAAAGRILAGAVLSGPGAGSETVSVNVPATGSVIVPGAGPDVAGFADRYLAALDPALVDDVRQLLQALEHSPLLLGIGTPFTALSADRQDRVLRDWQDSRFTLRRQGFFALKSLCCLGFYQDPRSFAAIGYSGPMLP